MEGEGKNYGNGKWQFFNFHLYDSKGGRIKHHNESFVAFLNFQCS